MCPRVKYQYVRLETAVILLGVADLVTTWWLVLAAGVASEWNPISNAVLARGGIALLACLKLGACLALVLVCRVLAPWPRARRFFLVLGCLVLAAPALWNLHDLLLLAVGAR